MRTDVRDECKGVPVVMPSLGAETPETYADVSVLITAKTMCRLID